MIARKYRNIPIISNITLLVLCLLTIISSFSFSFSFSILIPVTNSSTDTSNNLANGSILSNSGVLNPVYHFDIVCLDTPRISATSS